MATKRTLYTLAKMQLLQKQLKSLVCVRAEGVREMCSEERLLRLLRAALVEVAEASPELDVVRDPDWGCVVVVTLEASARKALETWLKLQKKFKGIPIVVRWTRPNDVSEEELVDYMVEILNAGGFKARALQRFSAVEAVKEERDRFATSRNSLL
jgi:hypothetical protein